MNWLALIVMLAAAETSIAQGLVSLHMTKQQVHSQLGQPASHRGLAETFFRRSGGVEFAIDVAYAYDDSVSKLHPALRVSSVAFMPDVRESWAKLAVRIPEVRAICINKCDTVFSLAGDNGQSVGLGTFVLGCRSRGTAEGEWWTHRSSPETCFKVLFKDFYLNVPIEEIAASELEVDSIFVEEVVPSDPAHGLSLPFLAIRDAGGLTLSSR